jgi:hypothetical protein
MAQNPMEIPEYSHQGSLVSLRIVAKDRTAKIFVAGNKAVEMNLKQEPKLLSVSLLDKSKREVLKMDKQGDFYEVRGLPAGHKAYQLLIEAELQGQIENMKVNIPSQKP